MGPVDMVAAWNALGLGSGRADPTEVEPGTYSWQTTTPTPPPLISVLFSRYLVGKTFLIRKQEPEGAVLWWKNYNLFLV